MNTIVRLTLLSCAIAAAGCATPSAVYELADKTSAHAAIFAQHLGTLAAQSRTLADKRAAHVASMDAFNKSMQADYQRDVAITKKVGDFDAAKRIIDDLSAFRDELERIEQAGVSSESERRQEIMSAYVALAPNTQAVRDIANTLSGLAHKESRLERVKFLAGFAGQVRDEAKVLLAKDDALSKGANALLDKLGVNLAPTGNP